MRRKSRHPPLTLLGKDLESPDLESGRGFSEEATRSAGAQHGWLPSKEEARQENKRLSGNLG